MHVGARISIHKVWPKDTLSWPGIFIPRRNVLRGVVTNRAVGAEGEEVMYLII